VSTFFDSDASSSRFNPYFTGCFSFRFNR